MPGIEIKRVVTRRELKRFIDFPFRLFKDSPYWCPPLKFDEIRTLQKDRNPAFEYCEAEYWLAYRNGNTVGRIAGIINHREVQHRNDRKVRFGWIDFVDDPEVSAALIRTVEEWGRLKGMGGIRGPLGFTDMDPEGMLVEGFEEISAFSAIYNYPYYPVHLERLGFIKAADWVQFEVKIPAKIPEKIERLNELVLRKYHLRLVKVRKARDLRPYAPLMFQSLNDAFGALYGFTALSEKQIRFYTDQYFGFIRPEFVSMVMDDRNVIAAFGISLPCLSQAIRKARGRLFPFGFYHILRAMRRNDIIHMYLAGVHPDYQGKGILSAVYHELAHAYMDHGIRLAHTHPALEDNSRMVAMWKNFETRQNIRRRCWKKEF